MVVGVGCGFLVRVLLIVVEELGWKVRIYVVEKNLNVVVMYVL